MKGEYIMGIVTGIFILIAFLAAIAGTVLAYIYVVPEEAEKSDNKIISFLHGFFNFKKLYIEDIVKALYIFTTLCCVCCGAANILSSILSIFFQRYMIVPRLLSGLGLIILAPIVTRLAYESMLLIILLVKNVQEINKKVK